MKKMSRMKQSATSFQNRVMSLTSKALFTLVCFPFVLAGVSSQVLINDSQAIQDFLLDYNTRAGLIAYDLTEATWNFNTNLTDYNQNITLDKQLKWDQFLQEAASNATGYDTSVMSEADKRQFQIIKDIGISAQTNETKLKRLNKILSDMESIYSTAKVCLNSTNCVPLDPDLTKIMAESRDYQLLLDVWKGWSDASGRKMKDLYPEYVELSNEAVQLLGYTDTGAYWRSKYETPTFEEDVLGLYNQLRPLYEQLHAYVRRKLKAIYGSDNFPASGHIPAHILGNMWAQEWDNLIKELSPYPKKPTFDVTDEMIRQNYTALKIFQTADSFFQSLGLIPMPPEFWNKSVFERPADGREIVCHASAWDFNNGKDFRIKQCTVVNSKDFNTAHHEMGHIEYFLQYANQPIAFRDGANPGFHEAVGDTISLSVNTPEHMYAIGLLKESIEDKKSDINYLMSMALEKIAFLPFGYLIDQWRWKVFRGDITPDKYNEEWWNLRCRYQGIFPPVARSSDDFDPGAKYHIPANYPYISYFVSFVIQFQFHKALCDEAGYKGPLHRCDIYNNTKAGKKLSDMLQLGRSQPWPVAMKIMTGQTKMDAQPLMDYFKPLINFLKKENGEDIGWQPNCPSY
ncbi:Angiotensin-converting enzyme (ACE) [Biomphalaria glabrata]|nr:Angiotensin-converting enzyme (ACE) [Biomphalaria glabrata]